MEGLICASGIIGDANDHESEMKNNQKLSPTFVLALFKLASLSFLATLVFK